MSHERKQILQMLADGKITPEEAERLLDAVDDGPTEAGPTDDPAEEAGKRPKHLHIHVIGGGKGERSSENINIKVPIFALKAGLKLGGIVPGKAKARVATQLGEMGFDLDDLSAGKVDDLCRALTQGEISIIGDKEVVNIFCK